MLVDATISADILKIAMAAALQGRTGGGVALVQG